MLPDTVVGLIVFTAAAGPGYLYVRLSQARSPRSARSGLEEAAEFVVFGAFASAIAVLAALAIGNVTGLLDLEEIANGPAHYVILHPGRTLLALAAVLSVSYGGVWLVTTKMLHRGEPSIRPGETAWYVVFKRSVPDAHGVYATVELEDETAVAGLVTAYTVETDDQREIVVTKPVDRPLVMRTRDGRLVELPDTSIILPGHRVRAIGARYTPVG